MPENDDRGRRRFLRRSAALTTGAALLGAAAEGPAVAQAETTAAPRELGYAEKLDGDWVTWRQADLQRPDLNAERIPGLSLAITVAERPVLVSMSLPVVRADVAGAVFIAGFLVDGAFASGALTVIDQVGDRKAQPCGIERRIAVPPGTHTVEAAVARLAGSGAVLVGAWPGGLVAVLRAAEVEAV